MPNRTCYLAGWGPGDLVEAMHASKTGMSAVKEEVVEVFQELSRHLNCTIVKELQAIIDQWPKCVAILP